MFVVIAAIRMHYPYELEWIEGAGMDEIHWIMQGKPLYGLPSVSFIPSTKTPLYYLLSAGMSKILGYGFFAPRLLSIIASLGIFFMLYLIVRGDGAHPAAGFLAAGVMAASFRFTGAWLDLVKTDALFVFFLLAACYMGQKYTNKGGMVASGLLFVLAYYTKQLALVIIIALGISSLVETRGRSWIRWLTICVVGFLVLLIADRTTNGWFSFYSIDALTYHNWEGDILTFVKNILQTYWPALLIGIVYIALSHIDVIKLKFPGKMWQNLSLVIATLVASASVFLKSWTYDNGYIPAAAGISVLIGLGFDRILRYESLSTRQLSLTLLKIGAVGLVLLQFLFLAYNPIQQLPTIKDRQAAQSFVEMVKSLPGEVLIFNHGYYDTLAGKNSYLHSSWLGDIYQASLQTENKADALHAKMVMEVFSQAIASQRFDSIIVDDNPDQFLPYYIVSNEPLIMDQDVFFPVTGAHSRPDALLVKNPVLHGGALPLIDSNFRSSFIQGWQIYQNELWASDQQSVVRIALEQGHEYQIKITLQPACSGLQPNFDGLSTKWNNQPFGTMRFISCEPLILSLDLPVNMIRQDWNQLSFTFSRVQNQSGNTNPALRIATFSEISIIQK
jgi:hypothetical protein